MTAAGGRPAAGDAARTLDRLHRFYAAHPGESREDDALLCHVLDHNQRKVRICSTDLVRSQLFGTLPTVTGRLARLLERGLLRQITDGDRRIRLLEVTKRGIELLDQRSYLVGPRDDSEGPQKP